jgi:hypothetical protein
MKKNTIPTLRSAIAYTLLISQLLTSCVKPVIHPEPEALCPITHHQAPQENAQQAIIATRPHHTVVAKSDSGKVMDHSTITNSTKRQRKAITITQPVGSKKIEQLNCLPSQKLFTEQVKQELHKRIEQTLKDPAWRQHLLEDKSRDRKASEVNTIPQNHDASTKPYQPARIQTTLQPLTPALTLPVKEGLTIRFIQDMNHWWGVVEEMYPGCSRSTVLPVLYQQSLQIPTNNAHHVPSTIENLSRLPLPVQQQLVHIFSSNKTLRDAFIYIGEQMGLNGAGLGSFIGSCIATTVVSVGLGMGIGFLINGPIGMLVGGILGGLYAITYCVKMYQIRERTRKELEKKNKDIKELCEKAIQTAKDKLEEVKKNPKAYKNEIRKNTLRELGQLKESLNTEVKKFEKWGESIKESNWFFGFSFNMNILFDDTIQFMWDEDFDYLRERISKRKKDVEKLDDQINYVKDEFKRQAWEDLSKDRKKAEENTATKKAPYDKTITGITDRPEWFNAMKDNITDMKEQLCENIKLYESWKAMYEGWQKEAYPIDTIAEVAKMQEYIKQEQKRLAFVHKDEQLVCYASQSPNNLKSLQQIKEKNDLTKALASAAIEGNEKILYYAFQHHHESPNMVIDIEGNTLLHCGVEAEHINVIQLCLEYGANKLAKNQYGETPVDLAANKPHIKRILEAT